MVTGRGIPEPAGIAVMARAPVAGQAKTRLIPALGAAGAARLHRALTLRALTTAQAAGLGPVTLWHTPDPPHRFFRAVLDTRGIALRAQAAGDLGQRMARVFAECGDGPLLLIGSDCPALTPEHLRQAARALGSADAAFITAEDGGYVLVGLRRSWPAVFAGIDWGSDRVMQQTRRRLAELGLTWRETARLWDVDRIDDLRRWQSLQEGRAGTRTL